MGLFNFLKKKKLLLLNVLLTLYIATNLIGGERGLISYYEKEKKQINLIIKEKNLSKKLSVLKHSVPEYIESNESLFNKISKISKADLKDGGDGAIYVVLKKNKNFKE